MELGRRGKIWGMNLKGFIRRVQDEYDQNKLYEFLKELIKSYKKPFRLHHTQLICGLSMPTYLCSTVGMVANGG